MKFYIIILFTILLCKLPAQSLEQEGRKLSVAELQEDFNLLRTELEDKHPALYLYTNKMDLDSVFRVTGNSIQTEMTGIDFFRKINKLNSIIKDGHTGIISPVEFQESLETQKRFPFSIYTDQDKSYILENYSDDQSIPRGTQILEINKQPVEDLILKFSNGLKRDGYNLTSASYYTHKYFSWLYALNIGCPESFSVQLKLSDDSIISKEIQALSYPKLMDNGLRKTIEEEKESMLEDKVVNGSMVVTLKSFIPVLIKEDTNLSYKKAFKKIFQKLHDLEIKRLIIDIRDNPGGWSEVTDEFLAYLIPYTFVHDKSDKSKVNKIANDEHYIQNGYIKHFNRQRFKKSEDDYYQLIWNDKQKPKKPYFSGEVIVLINGGCGSQSGAFAGLIDEHVDVTFIGEETGANRVVMCGGNIVSLVLPNSKVMVEIPLRMIEIQVGRKNDGHGVIPDIILRPSINQKLNGEDIVLKKALEMDIN